MVVLAVVGTAADWILFYRVSDTLADLAGLLLFIGTVIVALHVDGRLTVSTPPDYDVTEIAVEGPISCSGGGGLILSRSDGTPAGDIAEQVDAMADDDSVDALPARLNTSGGEVLPNDDIRRTVADFDGPTVAYAADTCASGDCWVTSGCGKLWSHGMNAVGSTGVIGSSVSASELADKIGLSYERFIAGKYKDAGMALGEPTEDEREYFQGLIGGYYDDFVGHVTEGRDMDLQVVCDTETRVYLDEEAYELGLVGSLGSRDGVEDRFAEHLSHDEVSVRELTPEVGLTDRFRGGAEGVAYALDAGLVPLADPDDGLSLQF